MSEIVLDTNTLPEPLFRMIRSEKVIVREEDGEIRLIPLQKIPMQVRLEGTGDLSLDGLRGMFAGDPYLTVDKYLERKRADTELEL